MSSCKVSLYIPYHYSVPSHMIRGLSKNGIETQTFIAGVQILCKFVAIDLLYSKQKNMRYEQVLYCLMNKKSICPITYFAKNCFKITILCLFDAKTDTIEFIALGIHIPFGLFMLQDVIKIILRLSDR